MAKIIKSANTVDSKNSDYVEWLEDSHLPRTLLGGSKAMREAGETYLPKEPLEKKKAYENRLARSILVNMYRKTVSFLSGQVFSKNIVFDDDLENEIMNMKDDIDLAENSIDIFCKRAFEIGLGEGVFHILVESNNKDGEYTNRAEEKADGVRAYLRGINGSDCFGWIYENGNLVQVKIYESVEEREGEFGVNKIAQIRVLEPGRWRVYREASKSKGWAIHEEGETSLAFIPLVTFIPGKPLSQMTGETPLFDLAELNLDHWQSRSDQKNILHVARVPLLFARKIDQTNIEASTSSAIGSDADGSDLKYVEITGKSIEAGQKDLTETESKMALYGLQQLIQRTGNMTATEKAISSAESNSSLGCWVAIFESCLRKAFSFVAEYEKIENFDPEMISINKDFTSGIIDPEMVLTYLKMVENNVISAASAFKEIKKKGFISEELDWLDIQAEIDFEKKDKEGKSLIPFGG